MRLKMIKEVDGGECSASVENNLRHLQNSLHYNVPVDESQIQ